MMPHPDLLYQMFQSFPKSSWNPWKLRRGTQLSFSVALLVGFHHFTSIGWTLVSSAWYYMFSFNILWEIGDNRGCQIRSAHWECSQKPLPFHKPKPYMQLGCCWPGRPLTLILPETNDLRRIAVCLPNNSYLWVTPLWSLVHCWLCFLLDRHLQWLAQRLHLWIQFAKKVPCLLIEIPTSWKAPLGWKLQPAFQSPWRGFAQS